MIIKGKINAVATWGGRLLRALVLWLECECDKNLRRFVPDCEPLYVVNTTTVINLCAKHSVTSFIASVCPSVRLSACMYVCVRAWPTYAHLATPTALF